MSVDMGRLNVNSAGTAETFASDLAADSAIRANSRVNSIIFKAPAANTGNVFVGRLDRTGSTIVSSTYGFTLQPGDSIPFDNINEIFGNFEGDAANANDDIEWAASFEPGSQNKAQQ